MCIIWTRLCILAFDKEIFLVAAITGIEQEMQELLLKN
jgi:hypothetical protein